MMFIDSLDGRIDIIDFLVNIRLDGMQLVFCSRPARSECPFRPSRIRQTVNGAAATAVDGHIASRDAAVRAVQFDLIVPCTDRHRTATAIDGNLVGTTAEGDIIGQVHRIFLASSSGVGAFRNGNIL